VGRSEVTGLNVGKCGGKKRTPGKTGEPTCGLTAGYGTDHLGIGKCKFHGGNTPSHIKAASKTRVMQRMKAAYGDMVEIDPGQALLDEVKRSAGIVEWIASVVRDFTEFDMDNPDEKEMRRAALQQNAFDGWQAAAWVELFFKERRHLAAVSKMALDANVAERRTQIEQDKISLMAIAIKAIVDDLHPTAEQRAAFPEVARRHLLALEA
jgi:hypothetical protein